jgi:hypothetical protein
MNRCLCTPPQRRQAFSSRSSWFSLRSCFLLYPFTVFLRKHDLCPSISNKELLEAAVASKRIVTRVGHYSIRVRRYKEPQICPFAFKHLKNLLFFPSSTPTFSFQRTSCCKARFKSSIICRRFGSGIFARQAKSLLKEFLGRLDIVFALSLRHSRRDFVKRHN